MQQQNHVFYNIDRFSELFINNIENFDSYFIERDNNLVNSNEYYLQYKNKYIEETMELFDTFKILIESFNLLNNNYIKTDKKKYVYHYIDQNEYNILNDKLKNLLEIQKKRLSNFTNYIEFLNIPKDNTNTTKVSNNSRMSKLSLK